MTKTCTVHVSNLGKATVEEFVGGHSRLCGKPAWYTEVSSGTTLGECYEHAHQPGSLYLTRGMKPSEFKVGDLVSYKAYGGTYVGRIVRLGTKLADVTVTLQSGREKVLKNKKISDLKLHKI